MATLIARGALTLELMQARPWSKTLSTIRDVYLYFKPGFYRLPLSAMHDESGRIPQTAIEKIWPEASPFSDTWFIDGQAYWIGMRSLFSWPLAGGDVKVTELPAVNWYSLAANRRYLFVATLGCRRIRRIDFDADSVYWFRIDQGGHLMVTPRSDFGI